MVTFVAPDGPAAEYGLQRGDVILQGGETPVRTMAEFFQTVWKQGKAGVTVPLTIGRQDGIARVDVVSADRYAYMKIGSTF